MPLRLLSDSCLHLDIGLVKVFVLLMEPLLLFQLLAGDGAASVSLRFDVSDWDHFLDVLGQPGLVLARPFVLNRLLIDLDSFSDGDAEGEGLIVLLEAAILPRVEHFLVLCALL